MGCGASAPERSAVSLADPSSDGRPPERDTSGRMPESFNTKRRGSVSAEADKETGAPAKKKVIPKSATQRTFLKQAVSGIFLFADLDSKLLDEIVDAMERAECAVGDKLMEQGSRDSEFFYIIEKGKYRVDKDGKKVYEYNGTGFFGELALMYNAPRAATVVAMEAGVLWRLDRGTFRRMVTNKSKDRVAVSDAWLAKVPVISTLSKGERAKLADALLSREFKDNEVIIQQGAYGDAMFIIEEGTAVAFQDVRVHGITQRQEVGRHSAGDYFGERSLITDEPRAATVMAEGLVKAWTIDRASFERLMGAEHGGDIKNTMTSRMSMYRPASTSSMFANDGSHARKAK